MAYLLDPHLQSALLTEFHAIPLAVPFVLWALWAVEARRWRQFVVAAVLLALVKEEAALLAALLGLWAIWRAFHQRRSSPRPPALYSRPPIPYLPGAAIFLVGLAWFGVTTFAIIPAYAASVYGENASVYFQRYGALGNSAFDIFASFFTQPGLVWQIATEPARVGYLLGLLGVFGFVSLAGLDVLLLSLPLLLANLLSAYPAQYYGEFHYSAPLVPYFAAAAVFGGGRLLRLPPGRWLGRWGPRLLAAWLLVWAGWTYAQAGRGPWGGRYDPAPVSAHARLLATMLDQIPSDAAITATAAVHPHVSHRRYAYQFPAGLAGEHAATWALIDVTTATDMAPGDVRDDAQAMLRGDWGVVDADDGFLLMHRGETAKTIPPAFFDFARRHEDPPRTSNPITFASLAADDQPRWRQTSVITRWLVGSDYEPGTLRPWLEVRSPAGDLLYTFEELAPPALIWYPPEQWQPGDLVTILTTPLSLPRFWGAAIGVVHGPESFQARRPPSH